MNNTEIKFFENYKRLDRLCRDNLHSDNGVTDYITQMERTPPASCRGIRSWNADYRMLKHVRWLRNKIAHCETCPECTRQDIDFVIDFYARLSRRQDPLSQLRSRHHFPSVLPHDGNPAHHKHPTENPTYHKRPHRPGRHKRRTLIITAVIVLLLLIAAVLINVSLS